MSEPEATPVHHVDVSNAFAVILGPALKANPNMGQEALAALVGYHMQRMAGDLLEHLNFNVLVASDMRPHVIMYPVDQIGIMMIGDIAAMLASGRPN